MKAVKKIEISVLHKRITPIVYAVQADTGREIECTVDDWDIPAGVEARAWVIKPSKKVVYNNCRIVGKAVFVALTNQMLAEPGGAICMIEFVSGEDVVSSFSFNLYVYESASGDGIESNNESTVLEKMFEELAQDAIKTLNEAKAQAAAAKKSAQDTEKIKNDFTLTAQQAVADVNNAGQTQTQRVNTAGDTQVSRIQAEGTTQVQNVQATAAEIAADREQIHTNRDNTARLQRTAAGSIMRSAEGSFITLEDAADEMGFRRIEIEGETRQVTTTGAQMIDFEQCLKNWKSQYTQVGGRVYKITAIGAGYQAPVAFSENDIKVTLSGIIRDLSGSGYRVDLIDSSGNIVGRINKDIKSITGLASKIRLNFAEAGAGEYSDIMLNAGSAAIPWEPYTGSKPSPSPEYPQELRNVGVQREDGKFKVKVTACKNNLLDMTGAKGGTSAGITTTVNPDGTLTSNGTGTGGPVAIWLLGGYRQVTTDNVLFTLKAGKTYYISDVVLFMGTEYPAQYKFFVDPAQYPEGFKVTGVRHAQIDSGTVLTNKVYYPRVILGDTDTGWEPYRGHTATITSDRPLTKWDKLTCRDGVWGWAYGGTTVVEDGSQVMVNTWYPSIVLSNLQKRAKAGTKIYCNYCNAHINRANDNGTGICINDADTYWNFADANAAKTWLTQKNAEGKPFYYQYETQEEEWVPLSAEEQAAMNALCTYAGTTHIWTDDPLQPVISLDYTVDTEGYIRDTAPAYRDVERFALTGEAAGTVATCTDSAEWPLLGVGMLGKCEQLTTTGANLFGGRALADKIMEVAPGSIIDEDKGTITFASNIISGKTLYDNFEPNKRYTIILCGKNTDQNYTATNLRLTYDDGINVSLSFQTANTYSYCVYSSTVNKTVVSMSGTWVASKTELQYDKCGIFEGAIDLASFEPYTGAAPSPSPAYPQEIQETGTYNPETGMYEAVWRQCGAQLLDIENYLTSHNANYTIIDNVITVDKIGVLSSHPFVFSQADVKVTLSGTFKDIESKSGRIELLDKDNNVLGRIDATTRVTTAIASKLRCNYHSGTSFSIENIMLNVGDTALPWEPYQSDTLRLTADQPWRGIGDAHDEVCERDGVLGTWRRYAVVDNTKWGMSNVQAGTTGMRFAITLPDMEKKQYTKVMCSHFTQKNISSFATEGEYISTSESANGKLMIRVAEGFPAATAEEFCTWAQETGLYTVYPRETPVWEPFPEEIQRAYRKLKSYAGTTHAWVDDPLQPEVSFKYVKDSNVVVKNLQLDIAEQITDLQAQIDQLTINNNL